MANEHSGGGDPARTIALLWGRQKLPRRGPRQGLDPARIATAAIDLADGDGLAALSMRRVAERLGVSPMALYTYVPAKSELIDLMLDAVYAETLPTEPPSSQPPSGEPATGDWRARLEAMARANWAMFRRHPWMMQVAAATRPVLGPNALAKYDHELRAVDGIGLDDLEMDSVLALVGGHAEAAARRAADATQTERATGRTDLEWWEAVAPVLTEVYPVGRYPLADRVGLASATALQAAFSPEHAFEFGLQRVLDGIEALVRARQAARDGDG